MTRGLPKTFLLGLALALCAVCLLAGPSAAEVGPWRQPAPGTSWQWQLSSQPGTPLAVDAYDLDDFAITEDCLDQNWCHKMSPFIDQNKAVLAAEYTDTGARLARFCPRAEAPNFDAILKKRNLGPWRRSC